MLGLRLSSADYWTLACVALNTFDALITWYWVTNGCSELNPILAFIMRFGMVWFMVDKLLVVNLLIVGLGYFFSSYRLAKVGLISGTAAYSLLFMWHIVGLVKYCI